MITRIFIYLSIILAATSSFAQDKEILTLRSNGNGLEYVNSKNEVFISTGDKYVWFFGKTFDKIAFAQIKGKGLYAINREEKPLFEVLIIDNGPDYVKEGLFRIIDNNKMGFANMDGEIIIKPQFDFVGPFQKNGYATFNIGGNYVVHDSINYYRSWEGGKWGLINKNGDVIVKPIYDAVSGNNFILNGKHVPMEEVLHLEE